LPILNEKIETLNCCYNKLTYLPHLKETIKYLRCQNNELKYLPELNEKLEILILTNNPFCHILYSCKNKNNRDQDQNYDEQDDEDEDDFIYYLNINIIKAKFKMLHNFRFLYYSLKFKNKFRDWLWKRVREPKIQRELHPTKLFELLKYDDEDDINGEILNLYTLV